MNKQQPGSDGAHPEVDHARHEAQEAELTVDRLADKALEDYERRRGRLAADLTGELPNDSPEAR